MGNDMELMCDEKFWDDICAISADHADAQFLGARYVGHRCDCENCLKLFAVVDRSGEGKGWKILHRTVGGE